MACLFNFDSEQNVITDNIPWVKAINKNFCNMRGVGGFWIADDNMEACGWKKSCNSDICAKDCYEHYKGVKQHFVSSQNGEISGRGVYPNRILVIRRTKLLKISPQGLYLGLWRKGDGEFVDKNNAKLYVFCRKYLLMFLDEHHQPLHLQPLQFTAKGTFSIDFDTVYLKFRNQIKSVYLRSMKRRFGEMSEQWYSMCIFSPKIASVIVTGKKEGKKSEACKIESYMEPNDLNWENLIVGRDLSVNEQIQYRDVDLSPQNKFSLDIILDMKTDKAFYKYGNVGDNCTISRQEYVVAENLLKKCGHIPHFLRPIVYIKKTYVSDNPKNVPFHKNFKENSMCVDTTVFEYLNHCGSLHDFSIHQNHSKILKSSYLQIICAIISAQQNCSFVHNDLHSKNVVLMKCDDNLKFLYKINFSNEIKYIFVNTLGYLPIMIDYGFSYSKECENMSLECAETDNHGMFTYKYDELSDFIRLMVVAYKSNNLPKSSKLQLYNYLKNTKISLDTSWETVVKKSSIKDLEFFFLKSYVLAKHENIEEYDFDEKEYMHICQILKLLCRIIILPIKKRSTFNYDNKKIV